jgi:lactam utilization protein B
LSRSTATTSRFAPESICVHFDTPGAVSVAKAARSALAEHVGKAA